MKVVLAIIGSVAILRLFCGEYEIDPFHGIFRFSSTEEAVESGIASEFKRGTFKDIDPRVETNTGANVDPQPIRFHSKNRLKNGDLLIVKRKVFGNNMRDGHRFIFYFYGAGDLGSCTQIMNGELGLDNKYHIHRFKRNNEYSWLEIRSRFVLLD
jgi:hypothetical protein